MKKRLFILLGSLALIFTILTVSILIFFCFGPKIIQLNESAARAKVEGLGRFNMDEVHDVSGKYYITNNWPPTLLLSFSVSEGKFDLGMDITERLSLSPGIFLSDYGFPPSENVDGYYMAGAYAFYAVCYPNDDGTVDVYYALKGYAPGLWEWFLSLIGLY